MHEGDDHLMGNEPEDVTASVEVEKLVHVEGLPTVTIAAEVLVGRKRRTAAALSC